MQHPADEPVTLERTVAIKRAAEVAATRGPLSDQVLGVPKVYEHPGEAHVADRRVRDVCWRPADGGQVLQGASSEHVVGRKQTLTTPVTLTTHSRG